jgi:nucleoside-diphosphate-sugar epimerase
MLNHTLTIFGDGSNYVSRIHVDDLLTVLERVASRGQPGAIYNVADDTPTRLIDLYHDVGQRLDMSLPHTFPRERALQVGIDPTIVSMGSASVRLCNERMKHDLGIELQYPGYQTWLDTQVLTPSDSLLAVGA